MASVLKNVEYKILPAIIVTGIFKSEQDMPKETETKFKLECPSVFRRKLAKIKARFISKKTERDIYYRDPSGRVAADVIRLRRVGRKCIFTVKKRVFSTRSRTYKVREELEASVDDAKAFGEMLKELGFRPFFRKKKIRELYTWKGAKILIDQLPKIGYYVEIEAPIKKIKKLARNLDLDMKKATSKNYRELLRAHHSFLPSK